MTTTPLPPLPPLPGQGGPGAHEPEPRRPRRRRARRAGVAALVASTALLGGVAGAGLVATTGAGDRSGATTTVVQSTPVAYTASEGSGSGIDAAAVYAAAKDGVVEISATGSGTATPDPFGGGGGSSAATGSGWVLDTEGHIATAAHVVDGATSIEVTFADGTTRTATLVGQDDSTDLAVLSIDPEGLTLHPLEAGSSADLEIGDAVMAIGSPFGYEQSVSTGVVSGLDRTIEAPNGFTVAHAFQTDAALNPGNSGGPILDASGKVVGMADQIATDGQAQQNSGVGFAVPSDLIAEVVGTLSSGERVEHAWLGVSTSDASGVDGAAVAEVTAGGPAATAGLRAGDVVTAVDGTPVAGSDDLVAAVAGRSPGDAVELEVTRDGQSLGLTVTLGTQPASTGAGG